MGNCLKKCEKEDEEDSNVSEEQRTESLVIKTEKLDLNQKSCIEQNEIFKPEEIIKKLDDNPKAAKEQKELFEAKKLSLVLDLDHTLLHSVDFREVTNLVNRQMLRNKIKQDKKKTEKRDLYCDYILERWIKFRPGIWNFLEEASKLYKLHICTMGSKGYAEMISKLLDPTGELFEGRVISTYGNGVKDLKGVLGLESTAIIMDDTLNVWPDHTENLILVGEYKYFPQWHELDEIPKEEQTDSVLDSSLERIKRIHSAFFYNPSLLLNEMDVMSILAADKWRVLEGCHIHFTPNLIVRAWRNNPEKHPLWKTALQLGATCTTEKELHVTHVVSNRNDTVSVKRALATERFVVSTEWIEAAAFLLCKPNESDFAVRGRNMQQ